MIEILVGIIFWYILGFISWTLAYYIDEGYIEITLNDFRMACCGPITTVVLLIVLWRKLFSNLIRINWDKVIYRSKKKY